MKKIFIVTLIAVSLWACTDRSSREPTAKPATPSEAASVFLDKHQGHAPDGVIGDRRIRPGYYLQMDVLATTRNFIQIWLPEICTYKGQKKPFFLLSSEDLYQMNLDTTATGGISISGKAGEQLMITGTAEEFEYGLYLTVNQQNISDMVLEEVSSSVCIQLTAAPDFRDPERENTYWYNEGTGTWDQSFITESLIQEGIERTRFYRTVMEPEQGLPLVVVESSTGSHALGLIFKNATGVGGNSQMSTGCIHSDGDSYTIAPGKSASREGLLIIHPEGKEAVLEMAREFLAAK
ncbi:MAG: hypothetical protein ABFS28_10495 [Bacteroidota bacterium]